jgi:hypothetical protein
VRGFGGVQDSNSSNKRARFDGLANNRQQHSRDPVEQAAAVLIEVGVSLRRVDCFKKKSVGLWQ